MKSLDTAAWSAAQIAAVEKERTSEVDEVEQVLKQFSPLELQRKGFALINLRISGTKMGLGRILVDFESATGGMQRLVANRFRVGDIVGVSEYPPSKTTNSNYSGVVAKVTETTMTVAFSDDPPDFDKVMLTRQANNVTYERMLDAVKYVQKAFTDGKQTRLMEVLCGKTAPSLDTLPDITFSDDNLNDSQKEAIKFCLASKDVGLIWGPPGTGKTTTVAELVRQLVKRGDKVLVCGPSNIAVDNLVEKLAHSKLNITRIGHPARLLPTVLDHALDIRIKSSDEGQLVNDVRKEIDQALGQANKCKSRQERRGIYQEIKQLRKELRQREKKVVSTMLSNSKVVLCTLNGAASSSLYNMEFDTVIIDEVTQALEAECWIAIPKGKRLIIAGDPLQLPPTVKSKNSQTSNAGRKDQGKDDKKADMSSEKKEKKNEKKDGKKEDVKKEADLEFTLFDRLTAIHGPKIKRLLNVQYRMHEDIMKFSSKELYENKLVAHDSVKSHLLKDLPGVSDTDETSVPVIFIDTAGNSMYESKDSDSGKFAGLSLLESASRYNESELGIVEGMLQKLVDAGVSPADIGIISPYNAQVERLNSLLSDRYKDFVEVSSVDGFQGREKEAIIISLVRSNDQGEVGFLSEKRRLNVAITRPRRLLVVVGDSDTLSQGSKFLKSLCEYLSDVGELRFP